MNQPDLKLQTARTLKWNAIDRVASQVLYALVGVVLANILSKTEFGLVGVLLIFQAFATILIDSGFGAALLREKNPTEEDYSTVFWFNLIVSILLYLILFLAAPWIARIFDNQQQLIPMSKVMFLSFIINGLAIIQTNRLMKQMNVRMIAISNSLALIAGGIAGVWLALCGAGAWALIWQTIISASVKTIILWATGGWRPRMTFSMATMRKIRAVGLSVFSSGLLNTISLNVYNFVIGMFYTVASLGVYTQADKWSKMGSASISQILTSTFVPLLSKVQDSREDFRRYAAKTARFTSFILLPAMTGMTVIATPLFHLLFGNKWDAAIPLFQMLTLRGIFIVLISLYNNYLLALGKSRHLIASETIKDSLIFIAILATIFFHSLDLLILGQLISGILTWAILLLVTAHGLQISPREILRPLNPFLAATIAMVAAAILPPLLMTLLIPQSILTNLFSTPDSAWSMTSLLSHTLPQPTDFTTRIASNSLLILLQAAAGAATYILLLRHTPELREATTYLLGRFRRH